MGVLPKDHTYIEITWAHLTESNMVLVGIKDQLLSQKLETEIIKSWFTRHARTFW